VISIRNITNYLEKTAPLSLQENYDNSGLIVGNSSEEVTKVLLCLDSIESIIDEAIEKKCNLIIAHHPIVFRGLKKFNGKNYVEKVIIKAIKNDIAIYACHTNLDNVLENGVNQKFAQKLGLDKTKILSPKEGLISKLAVFVPEKNVEEVRKSLFNAGAGNIGNYSDCSFNSEGKGTFKANENANPHVGETGKIHIENEIKIEVIFPNYLKHNILETLFNAHPYEEVAYDIHQLQNKNQEIGAGIIGELAQEIDSLEFLKQLKTKMKTDCVRHTNICKKTIKKVAICGGSGSFLLQDAIRQQADIFITGDFKYHEFFDAEDKIIIADIGHFESEQFTIELFQEILENKFKALEFLQTSINTNPINYL